MKWLSLLIFTVLCSCTTTKYIPVENVRTEKEYVDRWRVDTFVQNDTRFVYINGDTIIDRQTRWIERIKEVHDTILVQRTDSVPIPYLVEKELSKWERAKVDWGGWAMAALVTVIASLVWLWKRKT